MSTRAITALSLPGRPRAPRAQLSVSARQSGGGDQKSTPSLKNVPKAVIRKVVPFVWYMCQLGALNQAFAGLTESTRAKFLSLSTEPQLLTDTVLGDLAKQPVVQFWVLVATVILNKPAGAVVAEALVLLLDPGKEAEAAADPGALTEQLRKLGETASEQKLVLDALLERVTALEEKSLAEGTDGDTGSS